MKKTLPLTPAATLPPPQRPPYKDRFNEAIQTLSKERREHSQVERTLHGLYLAAAAENRKLRAEVTRLRKELLACVIQRPTTSERGNQ